MEGMKNLLIDMQETSKQTHLAKILGITYEEFTRLEYEIETDEKKGLIYYYRIEFSKKSPEEILHKIERLQEGCRVYLEPWEWEFDEQYDYDEQYEAIIENKNFLQKFYEELSKLGQLNELNIDDKNLDKILKRQIFISVIGTMETFLSDTFINLVFDNEKYFRNFVETHPEFKLRKFELRQIFVENENLKETAKRVMLDTIYHNLPIVKRMFSDTFKISFPEIESVYPLVLKRHDLVHRNGKTKDQKEVETDYKAIENLINEIKSFVKKIADSLGLN